MIWLLIGLVLLGGCDSGLTTPDPPPNLTYRSGLITLQFPSSDAYVFDFSSPAFVLDSPDSVDLTIDDRFLQRISAPYGIVRIDPLPDCTLGSAPGENVVEDTLARLREMPLTAPADGYVTWIGDVRMDMGCTPFFVRTAEDNYVLLLPVGHDVGALDRFWFVWVYAEDGRREFIQ